ncbi:hypothetical protein QQS21_008018 [Conoideocrella luteorostrata]|uniref:RxLR effector protein n=1 Tax=Conoideocrella luteorostrata TaxID=1105319 RepID=A0AAJ0FWD0_9HYPO|nr:hypothetical protein QQS21_008018 [Conoideocrella luteorostrata]
MVRLSALALLAFTASISAAPAPHEGHEEANEQIVDFNGKPLSKEKAAEFLKTIDEGRKTFDQIVASFDEKQQKLYQNLTVIMAREDELLSVPKGPLGNSTNSKNSTNSSFNSRVVKLNRG